MSNYLLKEDNFLIDVQYHKMKILNDIDLYKHIKFRNPHSIYKQFEILTSPYNLLFTTRNGSFVFQGVEDMFDLFRTYRIDEPLAIAPSYWSEKLVASDCTTKDLSHLMFDSDKFKSHIQQKLTQWKENVNLSNEDKKRLDKEINHEIYKNLNGFNKFTAFKAVEDFTFYYQDTYLKFYDIFEWDCDTYTPTYLWCCYAIVWAIIQYENK